MWMHEGGHFDDNEIANMDLQRLVTDLLRNVHGYHSFKAMSGERKAVFISKLFPRVDSSADPSDPVAIHLEAIDDSVRMIKKNAGYYMRDVHNKNLVVSAIYGHVLRAADSNATAEEIAALLKRHAEQYDIEGSGFFRNIKNTTIENTGPAAAPI